MKKVFASITSLALYGLPVAAMAQLGNTTNFGLDQFAAETNLGTDLPLIETVARIINILLGFLGVLAVLLVLWGGFKWMTAAGNEDQISEAKKLMGAGVVGLAIILAAFAVASFVVNQLAEATNARP